MNTIENLRILCAEIVEKAKSGHPGAPMGLSLFMYTLYTEFIVLDPSDPKNPSRDIFVLSNGHACVIQYVMNHLIGYLNIDDLKSFRQLNSRTPGHPEKNDCGIEITTGPLGQGVASSVGFAISSKLLKTNGLENHIFCLFGDGCYQEGISQEAFSLCSKLRLDNITFIYDFNNVTIDGPTSLSMNENVEMRFKSLNFHVITVNGNDKEEIRQALKYKANKPKVIILNTQIGKDSELENNSKSHGSPLGEDNIKKLREKYNLFEDPFFISPSLKEEFKIAKKRMGDEIRKRSFEMPLRASFTTIYSSEYKSESLATRKHFYNSLNDIKTGMKIICGCADLTPSVLSYREKSVDFEKCDFDNLPNNIYLRFGIREHSMCSVMNGIASHGFFIPICGTFLNFISYGFPSVRLAALDQLKTIYVLTHDSIGLGEDGPTHQPIEVAATLRATPGLTTFRPCDGRETRSVLAASLNIRGPAAIILSRQKVAEIEQTKCLLDHENVKTDYVQKGAYYLSREENHQIILLATGSEVELAFKTKEYFKNLNKNIKISVVSFVSFELFDTQDKKYKNYILDPNAIRVSIEALSTFGWTKYSDLQIGIDSFGKSAPGNHVYEYFGFTPEAIAEKISNYLDFKDGKIY